MTNPPKPPTDNTDDKKEPEIKSVELYERPGFLEHLSVFSEAYAS